MIYLKINDTLYPASFRMRVRDSEWDDRSSISITLDMTYEQASALFVDGLRWQNFNQPDSFTDEEGNIITPDPITTDYFEYEVAGPITDNRDGTLTVKMGKPTADELLAVVMGI